MIIYRNPGSGLASFIILWAWHPRILASLVWRLSSAAHFSFELILTLVSPGVIRCLGNKTRGQRQYLLWENVVRAQIWWKLLLSYFGVNKACHVVNVSILRWQWHISYLDIIILRYCFGILSKIFHAFNLLWQVCIWLFLSIHLETWSWCISKTELDLKWKAPSWPYQKSYKIKMQGILYYCQF